MDEDSGNFSDHIITFLREETNGGATFYDVNKTRERDDLTATSSFLAISFLCAENISKKQF